MRSRRSPLQSQVVVHRDLDILLGAQITLSRLDRGMAEEELDLLEIPAVLPTQFGAGAAEVMGADGYPEFRDLTAVIHHPANNSGNLVQRDSRRGGGTSLLVPEQS